MKLIHECRIARAKEVPWTVAFVIERKRCSICGQWWKITHRSSGSREARRIWSSWPSVKRLLWQRREKRKFK
jgi:hypothetical protein